MAGAAETAMRSTIKVTSRMVQQANRKQRRRKALSSNDWTRVGAWVISPGRTANRVAGERT